MNQGFPDRDSGDRFRPVEPLVAAGVVLRRNQGQARASRFSLPGAAERGEDCEDRGVGGDDAETDRGDDGEAENNRHNQRNHDLPTLATFFFSTARKSVS